MEFGEQEVEVAEAGEEVRLYHDEAEMLAQEARDAIEAWDPSGEVAEAVRAPNEEVAEANRGDAEVVDAMALLEGVLADAPVGEDEGLEFAMWVLRRIAES